MNYDIIPSYRSKTRSLITKKFGLDNYYPDFFFYVAYRSGMTYIPQYNEIWYILKFEEEQQQEVEEEKNNSVVTSDEKK